MCFSFPEKCSVWVLIKSTCWLFVIRFCENVAQFSVRVLVQRTAGHSTRRSIFLCYIKLNISIIGSITILKDNFIICYTFLKKHNIIEVFLFRFPANWTLKFRVRDGDTYHYTTKDCYFCVMFNLSHWS